MRYSVEKTDKILYTGDNTEDVIAFFKKWEKKWGFSSELLQDYMAVYDSKGKLVYKLLINHNTPRSFHQSVIKRGKWLSYHKLNNGEIILIID